MEFLRLNISMLMVGGRGNIHNMFSFLLKTFRIISIYFKYSSQVKKKMAVGEKCQILKPIFEEYSPSCCGWRDEWVIVRGPCDDSPGAHQFTEAPGTSGHG